ncbi:DinB family protein [Aquimarina sp. MAR_2010_214]|uniref:DinB family protein n=1 Tax=Aquimarina sp. MAR_2010_214 TaxID=1250026 RepID=UPI000C707262|nr:DinB family protein [Aquimarina sp. MAR_2010_214]PKV52714.1 DinB family protein [Aquimarina sp. MAR_2010_214]
MREINKPVSGEFPAYSHMYMNLLQDDGKILNHLWDNFITIKNFICNLPEGKLYHRYAKNKWTIKEILVHIIDDERIFSYRALRYARNDKTPLPGFEENEYAIYSKANDRSLESIFDEYEVVRKSTIALFNYLPDDCFMRSGMSSGNINSRTVRGLVYHIAGHELRHFNIIKERYLGIKPEEIQINNN